MVGSLQCHVRYCELILGLLFHNWSHMKGSNVLRKVKRKDSGSIIESIFVSGSVATAQHRKVMMNLLNLWQDPLVPVSFLYLLTYEEKYLYLYIYQYDCFQTIHNTYLWKSTLNFFPKSNFQVKKHSFLSFVTGFNSCRLGKWCNASSKLMQTNNCTRCRYLCKEKIFTVVFGKVEECNIEPQ